MVKNARVNLSWNTELTKETSNCIYIYVNRDSTYRSLHIESGQKGPVHGRTNHTIMFRLNMDILRRLSSKRTQLQTLTKQDPVIIRKTRGSPSTETVLGESRADRPEGKSGIESFWEWLRKDKHPYNYITVEGSLSTGGTHSRILVRFWNMFLEDT